MEKHTFKIWQELESKNLYNEDEKLYKFFYDLSHDTKAKLLTYLYNSYKDEKLNNYDC